MVYGQGSYLNIGARGVEGISCQDGHHILIAQGTADDFITRMKMLAGNEDMRRKLTSNAYNVVLEKYSIA